MLLIDPHLLIEPLLEKYKGIADWEYHSNRDLYQIKVREHDYIGNGYTQMSGCAGSFTPNALFPNSKHTDIQHARIVLKHLVKRMKDAMEAITEGGRYPSIGTTTKCDTIPIVRAEHC